jgi:hypothetical protein
MPAAEPARAPRNPLRTNRFMRSAAQCPGSHTTPARLTILRRGLESCVEGDNGMLCGLIGWAQKGYKVLGCRFLGSARIELIGQFADKRSSLRRGSSVSWCPLLPPTVIINCSLAVCEIHRRIRAQRPLNSYREDESDFLRALAGSKHKSSKKPVTCGLMARPTSIRADGRSWDDFINGASVLAAVCSRLRNT